MPAAKSRIRIEVRSAAGKPYRVWVARDATVTAGSKPSRVERVGELSGRAIILIDSPPSIPGGMSMCQAGEERFLRIVSIVRPVAIETFRVKLESCRDNIELASPGIDWQEHRATLRIDWLQGPTDPGSPESRRIHVDDKGRPD